MDAHLADEYLSDRIGDSITVYYKNQTPENGISEYERLTILGLPTPTGSVSGEFVEYHVSGYRKERSVLLLKPEGAEFRIGFFIGSEVENIV